MWLKFAKESVAEQEFLVLLDKIKSITDPFKREDALWNLRSKVYEKLGHDGWDFYFKVIRPVQAQTQQEIRKITGEPELDSSDASSIDNWLDWATQDSKRLSYETLSFLAERLDDNRYQRWNDSLVVREVSERLTTLATQMIGINLSELSDPEKWSLGKNGFIKLVNYETSDGYGEGSIVQFFISPEGVGVLAEISDPMPLEFQKNELAKVIADANKFPDDWNKDITFIEGGDFQEIVSGGLNKEISLFRMMSFEEFNAWERGEVIPTGKFFATKRNLAQGTDFGTEGDRDIFSFRAKRDLFSGDINGVLRTNKPTHLVGHKLVEIG